MSDNRICEIPAVRGGKVVHVTIELSARKVANLCRRYESGEPVGRLASELGVTDKVVKRILKERSVTLRGARDVYALRRGFDDAQIAAIHARYMAGESTVDLANDIGCHSSTLRNTFKRKGLQVRSFSEMQHVLYAKRTPEDVAKITAAANAAARGRRATLAERCRRALTKERSPGRMTKAEAALHAELEAIGLPIQRERACGPYNIDFAIGHAVAVECFGGGWHASGRHAARHEKRCRYLLDAGWHVVLVWVDGRRSGPAIHALEHVISQLQRASRDPAALRQYRVVGSDGEVVARGADADDLPLKPPGELRRDPTTGRYYRA